MTHLKAEPQSSSSQNKAHPRRRDPLPAWLVFPGRHAFDRRSVVGPAGGGYFTNNMKKAAAAPLVAAQAGSKFARRLAQQIPAAKTSAIIAEAVENPKLMAALLKRGRTPKQRREMQRQVNAFLLQTTVTPDEPAER
jgi:hypothetical protein